MAAVSPRIVQVPRRPRGARKLSLEWLAVLAGIALMLLLIAAPAMA